MATLVLDKNKTNVTRNKKGNYILIKGSIQQEDITPIRPDQISRSVVSDSLQPHESQHARPPCPSQTPGVHSDSCPSSQRCHPAISSSVVPFSSCPQSFPESGRPCIVRKKTPGSKDSSTSGLSPQGHLERQAEFHASTQDEA